MKTVNCTSTEDGLQHLIQNEKSTNNLTLCGETVNFIGVDTLVKGVPCPKCLLEVKMMEEFEELLKKK